MCLRGDGRNGGERSGDRGGEQLVLSRLEVERAEAEGDRRASSSSSRRSRLRSCDG
jgi:hypothetical protein